jgi:hypothetical protein
MIGFFSSALVVSVSLPVDLALFGNGSPILADRSPAQGSLSERGSFRFFAAGLGFCTADEVFGRGEPVNEAGRGEAAADDTLSNVHPIGRDRGDERSLWKTWDGEYETSCTALGCKAELDPSCMPGWDDASDVVPWSPTPGALTTGDKAESRVLTPTGAPSMEVR